MKKRITVCIYYKSEKAGIGYSIQSNSIYKWKSSSYHSDKLMWSLIRELESDCIITNIQIFK